MTSHMYNGRFALIVVQRTSSCMLAMMASRSLVSKSPGGVPVVSMLLMASRKPSSATWASVMRKATCGQGGSLAQRAPDSLLTAHCLLYVKDVGKITKQLDQVTQWLPLRSVEEKQHSRSTCFWLCKLLTCLFSMPTRL